MVRNGFVSLSWSAPQRGLDAGAARRSILAQHQQIRSLLERARAVAEAAFDGGAEGRRVAADVVGELRSTMDAHLTYEERVLLPLLRSDLPLGPQRAEALLAEHRHQREMLSTVHNEARHNPGLPLLATKLAFLASWLLADMEEEERSLLTPDVVRDDVVVVGQVDG
jgi:iron-sulfur cluster repair protein YtfE (RIC family)